VLESIITVYNSLDAASARAVLMEGRSYLCRCTGGGAGS